MTTNYLLGFFMFNFSSKTKLLMTISVVLIVAIVPTSLFNYYQGKDFIRESYLAKTMDLLSDSLLAELQSTLLEPIAISSAMANNTFLQDWILNGEKSKDELRRYFAAIKEHNNYDSVFFISDATGLYYNEEGAFKEISPSVEKDAWFYSFRDSKQQYQLNLDTNEAADDEITVFVNYAIKDAGGKFIGTIGVGIKVAIVGEILVKFRDNYDINIFWVDGKGLIQVHLNDALIETTYLEDLRGIGKYSDDLLNPDIQRDQINYSLDGETVFVARKYFPEFDWFLIIEQNESKSLDVIKGVLFNSLSVAFVVLLVVLVVIFRVISGFQLKLEIMAITDELTGLNNRRFFTQTFSHEAARAKRNNLTTSLLQMDLDFFKKINDQYGHTAGDRFLVAVAEAMKSAVREIDCLARTGGEEFVALLVETDQKGAEAVAERIRGKIESLQCEDNGITFQGTMSIGLITCSPQELELEDTTRKADEALYQAKKEGRNRVVVFSKKA
jgi:diguanylate cyclase (GGDEF)-like protein